MFAAGNPGRRFLAGAVGVVAVLFVLARLALALHTIRLGHALQPSEPWISAQVEQPADLLKELAQPQSKKPVIVYVGFPALYRSAHLPGAVFEGTASKPEGLDALKKWAANAPRTQPIVIYCGCCPWSRCPNIRPAFKALHQMGFTRLKVLYLKSDLATDWVQKGFPVEKSSN